MAVDEALAEAVGRGESPPVVRLFGFSPATLSLGRFQRVKGPPARSDRGGRRDPRSASHGRPRGAPRQELTYSVALAKDTSGSLLGSARKREVYMFIARVLLHGLAHLGVAGMINEAQRGDLHNPDCFGSAGEYEIAARDGRKLIGSAQMTTRTAVLQHGSIPLENPGGRVFRYLSTAAPVDSYPPTCLDELLGRALSFDEVQDAFALAFRRVPRRAAIRASAPSGTPRIASLPPSTQRTTGISLHEGPRSAARFSARPFSLRTSAFTALSFRILVILPRCRVISDAMTDEELLGQVLFLGWQGVGPSADILRWIGTRRSAA